MKRFFAVAIPFALFTFLFQMPAACQTRTLWQIGKFDQSSREFTESASNHVVYEVGKSDWSRDWPGQEQPGAAYEIRFNLDSEPQGVFDLKVSLLTRYLNPDLQIEVNGHKGLYYVRTQPLYTGDSASWDVMTFELPTEYLAKGANSLVLEPVNPESAGGEKGVLAGAVSYDFVALTNDANAEYSRSEIGADVTPTVFYRRKSGRLVELVDAYLRFEEPVPEGLAVLTMSGNSYNARITARDRFGEERIEFEVPEWQGRVPATLKVTAGTQQTMPLSLMAERKWTVYVVPHTHVDVGYTDYQGKVAENQASTLTEAATLIKEHPDFRFATDGSWNLRQLLETRSAPEQNEILNLIRTDKIGVPADYFNLLTGYASLETLYRSLYYTKSLSRTYDLPFNYVTTTDIPSYTGAYPSVLASAGIKYWAVGANQDRAPVLAHEQWNEKSPFWWKGPDGKKVMFWYGWSYMQIWRFFTLEATNAKIYESVPQFLAPYDKPEYKPDAVLMYGAQGENTDLHPDLATFAPIWNQAYAYPRLQYATFADFFKYIDEHFGRELPTYKGDMGPYWEDGVGSDAYFAAQDRQNQSDVLTSEIVSTVAHIVNPAVRRPEAELDDAWNNILLFAEHTWDAGNSISQPSSEEAVKQLAVKDNFATQAHFELDDIANRSLYQFAHLIQISGGTLVLFNGLAVKRDALVETDLHKNQELVDLTTHETVPLELIWTKENFDHVRFLAKDLPPVGYKCFQIRATGGSEPATAVVNTSSVIENKYYRITVDAASGAVQSIFDKELRKEIVDINSPYRFGQYLYVTGGDPRGDGQTQMIHPSKTLPVAELTVHPAAEGQYLGAQKTPWGYSIKLRSSDVNTPEISLEILLFDEEKKIEFRYSVNKEYTTAKEGVYFAFPTSVTPPEFAYETQQGSVDPAHDLLKGACLEWFSIQKWMAVHDSSLAVGIVPIDVPLASFGDINRGLWPSEFHPKTATLFSYAMNNYWHTNYRAGQGGTFTFRYVITSAEHFDPAALSRLGWKSMEAPLVDAVANQDKVGNPNEPLPPEGASFLHIDNPNVALVTWKLAEDGKGTILRLEEIAGQSQEVVVQLPHGEIRAASLCNSVEQNLRALDFENHKLELKFRPHEVLTVRLIP